MFSKKIKKIITCLVITLSIGATFVGEYNRVFAMPATSVSQTELSTLENMTLSQLKAVAKPMPEDAIRTVTDKFGTTEYLKVNSALPENGNIYYIESTWKDGTHFQTFYKFLYVAPEEQNTVAYHVYVWDYVNDSLDHKGDGSGAEQNESLYKELYNALIAKTDSSNSNTSSTPSTGGGTPPSSSNSSGDSNSSSGGTNGSKTYTKKRLGGATRIETSALIANEYNNQTVDNVIIANGYGFADALSGSVLAKKLNAPILLTGTTVEDSSATLDYIKNHLSEDGSIYVLGGEGSVSVEFISTFNSMGFTNVKRLYGQDRYSTNKAVNSEINASTGTPIVIASGEGFADALSISSIASSKDYPIVLSGQNNLSNEAIEIIKNIKPSQVYVIGGISSISDEVKEQIKTVTGLQASKITRISGSNRYETSLAIAKYFNLDTDTIVFANGEGFADALSGSIFGAKYNSPIVLLNEDISAQKTYVDSTKYTNEIMLGGTGSISTDIENSLSK